VKADMDDFQAVRGMRDLLPEEAENLVSIIDKARKTAALYGYREAITPVVESFELLNVKSGEEIRSRMFVFEDLGQRKIVLRPEFTASIARLITTTLRNEPKPLRIFSVGSVYRYDEPQRGRYREFWQSNFELAGSSMPESDAEILLLTNRLMKEVGLVNYEFKLGHVGILRAIFNQEGIDEQTQNTILQKMDKKEFGAAVELVADKKCRKTIESLIKLREFDPISPNPFAITEKIKQLVEGCDGAAKAVRNLSDILELVHKSGCKINIVDPAFARGLEYYTGMIFEIYIPELEIAIGGGGRYDKLVEVFRGEPTPAVGVAHGLDRIALAKQLQSQMGNAVATKRRGRKKWRVIVIPINDAMKNEALKISELLRKADIGTELEVMGRKMARALEDADRRNVDCTVLVGEREIKEGKVVIRNLSKREQKTVDIDKLAKILRSQK
jgi:histidyl-tRNA synthetase